MARAIIVVDVQNDFCEGGALAVAGGAAVARAISQWLRQSAGEALVTATRDAHIDPGDHFSASPDYIDSWPPHCVVGTPGQDFHSQLEPPDPEAVFDKGHYSAAYSGFEGYNADGLSLDEFLARHQITTVDVVGLATDHCVKATALDAARLGYQTRVLTGLTAAVSPANLPQVTAELEAVGVVVA
ncbi:MAG: isochorismatase family protein [Propionibacteriaceae bacterium]|nr:isochorismatase family protein [Propionibacteriaceae bacterium]